MLLKYYKEYQDEKERRAELNYILGIARRFNAPQCIQDALIKGKINVKGRIYKVDTFIKFDNRYWAIRNDRYIACTDYSYEKLWRNV